MTALLAGLVLSFAFGTTVNSAHAQTTPPAPLTVDAATAANDLKESVDICWSVDPFGLKAKPAYQVTVTNCGKTTKVTSEKAVRREYSLQFSACNTSPHDNGAMWDQDACACGYDNNSDGTIDEILTWNSRYLSFEDSSVLEARQRRLNQATRPKNPGPLYRTVFGQGGTPTKPTDGLVTRSAAQARTLYGEGGTATDPKSDGLVSRVGVVEDGLEDVQDRTGDLEALIYGQNGSFETPSERSLVGVVDGVARELEDVWKTVDNQRNDLRVVVDSLKTGGVVEKRIAENTETVREHSVTLYGEENGELGTPAEPKPGSLVYDQATGPEFAIGAGISLGLNSQRTYTLLTNNGTYRNRLRGPFNAGIGFKLQLGAKVTPKMNIGVGTFVSGLGEYTQYSAGKDRTVPGLQITPFAYIGRKVGQRDTVEGLLAPSWHFTGLNSTSTTQVSGVGGMVGIQYRREYGDTNSRLRKSCGATFVIGPEVITISTPDGGFDSGVGASGFLAFGCDAGLKSRTQK